MAKILVSGLSSFLPRARIGKKAFGHFITSVSVALLVFGLAGCGEGMAVREERVAELEELYEAVVAVEVAIQVGVNYISYGPLVAKAATALAVYESEDDEANLVRVLLKIVIENYAFAARAWSIKITGSNSEWETFALAHPEMISLLGIHDWLAFDDDIDKAIRYFWKSASAFMAGAREGLAFYKDQ